VKKDGEFWMTFSDFIDNLDHIGICHLTPDSYFDELTELDDVRNRRSSALYSEWNPKGTSENSFKLK